jgi:hypothetical protein
MSCRWPGTFARPDPTSSGFRPTWANRSAGSAGLAATAQSPIAVDVTELAHANPTMRFQRLYQAARRVGRAHITSVINTIVLAYAGASLPLLLLLTAGQQAIGEVITSELLTQEIVRSAVGTIGLIAAVPITTALAALAAAGTPRRNASTPPQSQHRSRPRRRDPLEDAWGLPDDIEDHPDYGAPRATHL